MEKKIQPKSIERMLTLVSNLVFKVHVYELITFKLLLLQAVVITGILTNC